MFSRGRSEPWNSRPYHSLSLMGCYYDKPKGEEKYICPNGHKNSKEEEFCNEEKCMQNIKGLTQKSVKKIEEFKLKIETLNDLLN